MNEFEQVVVECLTIAALEGTNIRDPGAMTLQQVQRMINKLAPRVAAAIDVVATEYAEDVSGERGAPDLGTDDPVFKANLKRNRALGLAALRGEP